MGVKMVKDIRIHELTLAKNISLALIRDCSDKTKQNICNVFDEEIKKINLILLNKAKVSK
jgi:hypothetical protein